MKSKGIYSIPFNCNVEIIDAPFHKTLDGLEHCIDFSMPEGTELFASANGVVSDLEMKYQNKGRASKEYIGRANFILISHSNGEESFYCHLLNNSAKVKIGEKVKRGQVIALSGSTGYCTYPHLHFGIYIGEQNLEARFEK